MLDPGIHRLGYFDSITLLNQGLGMLFDGLLQLLKLDVRCQLLLRTVIQNVASGLQFELQQLIDLLFLEP